MDRSRSRFTYVVTGGGGRTLYGLRACPADQPEPLAGEVVHHFLVLTQTGTEISARVVDVSGKTIDAFSIPLR